MGFGSGGFKGGKGDLDGDFKVRGTTPQITIGDAGAEDTFLVFDGNAVDYRIGIDDGTDILEIGAGSAHGTTTAIKINSSGQITQLGHQTSPTNGHFLKFDGAKIIFDSVSSGGGADVGIANTFTEAQSISKDQDSELVALILKNESDSNNTNGLVSLRFDLEDTGGNAVDSAKIAVKKEAAFTATASTQDSSMVFSTSLNGTLTERMTLDSAGALALGDDTDQSAKIGRVHLGYDATNSDMAIFSHRDNANQTDFALRQRASGQTEINAKASQTIDFKINSANQAQFEADGDFNLLIDGAKIRFGANSEVTLAHVHDEGLLLTHTATGDNKPVTLTLKSEEDVIIADEVLGAINFKGGDSDGTDAILVAAGIEAVATDTHAADNNATKLAFKTAASEAATEKMTLTSAGNLGVGVTDPDSKLEVLSTSTQAKFSYDADSFATVTVADASHTTVATGESGNLILDAAGDIEINADGGNITFKDGSDVIFDIVKNSGFHTIDITGDIRLDASGGDIAFLDNGALALIFDLDHTSGESHIYSMIDEQDVVFRAAHTSGTGVEILRLTDGGQAEIKDNLSLKSDAAVLKFGASEEITLTHVADTGLALKHTATADDKPVSLTLQTGETDIAANDVIGKIDFQAPDEGTGTDAILVAAGIEAVSEGDFAADNNATKLSFKTAASEAAAEKMALSSAGNLSIAGDLTVTGADIVLGADSDGTDRTVTFGHSTLKTIMGIDDSADAFVINTDAAFDGTLANNSLSIDASHNMIVAGNSTVKGRIICDDTTAATSTTDGSLQTDGGLSVALDAVVGDDLILLSDASVIHFGTNSEVNLTHVADSGLQLTHTATGDNTPVVLTLKSSEADLVGETIGEINFVSGDSSGGDANLVSAGISAIASSTHSATSNSTKLSFKTAVSEAASEKMSLSPTGNLSITQDNAAITMGTNFEVFLTHKHNEGLQISHQGSGDNLPVKLTLKSEEDALIADEVIGALDFKGGDSDGTDTILVCAGIEAVATDTHAADNNSAKLSFKTAASETATEKMALSAAGDLSLVTDGAAIKFGADSEITLTHVHDDGLILKHVGTGDGKEPSLSFHAGDNDIAADDVLGSIFFKAPDEGAGTDAILVAAGIEAVSEGDFSSSNNATKLSFKTGASEAASEKMSISSVGNVTMKNTATGDDTPMVLTLQTGETDIAANDVIGKIDFQAPDEGTGTDAILVAAGIEAVSEGDFAADNNATKLSFKTGASEAAAEKMALSSGGDLTLTGTGTAILNNTATDGDPQVSFQLGGTTKFSVGVEDGDSDKFVIERGAGALGAAPVLEIDSSGNVTVVDGSVDFDVAAHDGSNGLKLGGTLVTSTAAELNLLDAGNGAMADGLWQGVERIAVATIDSNDHAVDTHNLGITIPDNAIVTEFYVDITTAFTDADGGDDPVITLKITDSGGSIFLIHNGAGGAADAYQAGAGSAFWNNITVRPGSQYGFGGGKTVGTGALQLIVGDVAFNAGEAKVYIKYIIGS